MDFNGVAQTLTLGEVAAVENLAGVSIAAIEDAPMGKTIAAFVYVPKRRANLDFTFEDALALKLPEAMEALGAVVPDPSV